MILECSRRVVRDVVFVIDTNSIRFSAFQLVRGFTENVTINLKVNAPETSFALIAFDGQDARLEFSASEHTDLSTLLPAINPALRQSQVHSTNTVSALNLLLSGGVPGGILNLRNDITKVAIVIIEDYSNTSPSLSLAARSLHAANIFDVYAVGSGSSNFRELQVIASDPSFVTYGWSQFFTENVIEQLCSGKQLYHIHLCAVNH